ncbi:MAG: hypothetical protein J6B92_03075 [Paraprevotella sp.]|nr:hypothetical protein [Paraprevotella sp.]
MRKTTFTAAFLCTLVAGTAQAQDFTQENGRMFVIPSPMTSNGKAILASYESNESSHVVTFYDEKLNATKSITLNLPAGIPTGSWTEEATVVPTGAKASDYSNINIHDADASIDAANIKSVVALANAMNQYYGYESNDENRYVGFMDIDGRISCYQPYTNFYLESFLGKQYPTNYITLADGHICSINRDYQPVYNENDAQWNKVPGNDYSYIQYTDLEFFFYTDYDANIELAEAKIYCSQTLFNDDNAWEFIYPIYQEEISYGTPRYYNSSENGVTLRREVRKDAKSIGNKVIDESGNELYRFECQYINNAFRLNGKTYLQGSTHSGGMMPSVYYLYSLDGKGNAIKSVRTTDNRKLANVGDGVINVNVDGENGNVVLTNMGGMTIDRKQTNGEAVIRFNTRHLSKGVYNVTLQRDGHNVANEKIVVK